MPVYLIVIISVLCALCLLAVIPVRLIFSFDGKVNIRIKLIWFPISAKKREKTETAAIEKQEKPTHEKPNAAAILKNIKLASEDIKKLAEYAARHGICFEKLTVSIAFGTGDAAATGIAFGILSGIVYSILSVLYHNTKIETQSVKITPDFYNEKFVTDFVCILRTRLAHIIVMGLKGFLIYRKLTHRAADGTES